MKARLRRNPAVYACLRRVRATLMERSLAALREQYDARGRAAGVRYSAAGAVESVRRRLRARGLPRLDRGSRRPRIFWIGTNWDQDNSGLLAALGRCGEVRVCRSAASTYGLRYRSERGPGVNRDESLVQENDRVIERQVREALESGPLDLLLGQMWANFVSADLLDRIQRLGVITVNIAMDDRLPEHWGTHHGVRLGSVGLGRALDLVLTSAPECCAWYAVEGVPAVFWPMASDPERFRPYPEHEKRFDITFIGNKYGLREKIVAGLATRGIHVEAFGDGWPNGRVNADQSAEIFGRSRIILGVGNVGYSEKILTLKLRDFDAPMAGALYLTHRNPDLEPLFAEGREIACYGTVDECARQVRHYLEHPAERAALAQAAAARARREHTWDRRLAEALDLVGLGQ